MKNNVLGLRILIVEDDLMVASLLANLLPNIGCEAIGSAASVDEAMEKIRSLAFDMVILDVNLRSQNSFSVAEELGRRGIAFVVVTGYSTERLPDAFRRGQLLQKPYRQDQLELAMRTTWRGRPMGQPMTP